MQDTVICKPEDWQDKADHMIVSSPGNWDWCDVSWQVEKWQVAEGVKHEHVKKVAEEK